MKIDRDQFNEQTLSAQYLRESGVCMLEKPLILRAFIFSFSSIQNPRHLPVFPLHVSMFFRFRAFNVDKMDAVTPFTLLYCRASAISLGKFMMISRNLDF